MNNRVVKCLKAVLSVLGYALIAVLALASFSLVWVTDHFGNIGFSEIMFHLHMPLKGTSQDLLSSFVKEALLPAIAVLLACLAIKLAWRAMMKGLKRKRKGAGFRRRWRGLRWLRGGIAATLIVAWLSGIVLAADQRFEVIEYLRMQRQQSNLIAEEYVSPGNVDLAFPEQKRNLIYIFMESAESSAQNVKNGGLMPENYIPEMTKLAKKNVSFSQSDKIEGASVAPLCGWTIAGMVAETAGLPLKLYARDDVKVDNSMDQYDSFMPGAVTLGDILEREGYRNVFMAGSDFVFGGRTSYCTNHGNFEILDYNEAVRRGVIRQGYYVWWGFEDRKLYKWAKQELLELAQGDEPFNFMMLTVDTHHEDGYVCPKCKDTYDVQYANVWACASKQVNSFIKWLKKQDFYENTTVVIAGDHCSMDTDFYSEVSYDKYSGETTRKVYNCILNAAVEPAQEKNRLFTTMDLFPTTLAALGVTIPGERLGLGTNLFSTEQTLSEKYGYEYLFDELKKESSFYNNNILYAR